jgi:hypothetical protein
MQRVDAPRTPLSSVPDYAGAPAPPANIEVNGESD